MNKLRDKFQNFMEGRYGVDELGRFLMYLSLGLIIVSFFVARMPLSTAAILLLIWEYIRMLSRNQTKRWSENQKFLDIKERFFGLFSGKSRAHRDKEHCYFRCPTCKKMLRVPKGKGKISIHCPQCHTEFIKHT